MANPVEILNSPEFQEANLETKRAIFVKHVAKTPDFANANAETQHAIIERFGLAEPEAKAETGEPDFSDIAPAPPASSAPAASQTKPTTENSTFNDIKNLSPVQQAGVLGGATVGAEAGRREVKAARNPPAVDSRAPGQKWMAKTGYGKGEGYTVQEVAEAYERAKNKGKISSKISPGRALGIEGWAEQKKLAEELASKAKLSEGAKTATRLLGKVPLGSTLMGAGAGLEGAQAYEAYQQGDYPLAAIHGLGALGSAASLIPHPATRLGGGALSLLSVPAAEIYKRLRK
jgi:hypothetical protein